MDTLGLLAQMSGYPIFSHPTAFRELQTTSSILRRKREVDEDDGSGSESDDDDDRHKQSTLQTRSSVKLVNGVYQSQPLQGPKSLTADEIEQYRIAGQPEDEILPEDFPHRPHPLQAGQGISGESHTLSAALKELIGLSPPIHAPDAALTEADGRQAYRSSQKHRLSVLVTILHRCILEGDWVRAGRAWGLLLRQPKHFEVDIRQHGCWGIGAEILLQRDRASQREHDEEAEDDADSHRPPVISREGFEKTRQYYEQLILEYPFLKYVPNRVDSRYFYPALFRIWIYVAQQATRRPRPVPEAKPSSSRAPSPAPVRPSSSSSSTSSTSSSTSQRSHSTSDPSDESQDGSNQLATRSTSEQSEEQFEGNAALEEAESIATRMDELMFSPEFGDDHELLHLRAMLALWIADLHDDAMKASALAREQREGSSDVEEYNQAGFHAAFYAETKAKRDSEVERAAGVMRKLRDRGGEVWSGARWILKRIDSDDDDDGDDSTDESDEYDETSSASDRSTDPESSGNSIQSRASSTLSTDNQGV